MNIITVQIDYLLYKKIKMSEVILLKKHVFFRTGGRPIVPFGLLIMF